MTTVERPNLILQRRAVLAMMMSACLANATAARADTAQVDLVVVDRETGEPLKVWGHKGRLFVAGQPGSRYSLRLTNRSAERVLVVPSVDGVNVVTGETAAYDQRGYVIGPYQSHDVKGWRKSQAEIAAFSFAPASRSYAARTGRPLDVGVIGIAVFQERVAPPEPMPAAPAITHRGAARDDAKSAVEEVVVTGSRVESRAAPQQAQERLGTAHGARERSWVTLVNFERASGQPALVRRIEYDSYDNLVVAGVIPSRRDPQPRRPRPFPSQFGFTPDPPAAP